MIDALFFMLQIVGIAILLGWAVIYDRRAEGSPSGGPLAFKQKDDNEKPRGRGVRHQRLGVGLSGRQRKKA